MLSGGEEYEFLSLALAEAISHDLSAIPDLVLRPTSAVVRYAGKVIDPVRVARDLSVAVVVEGSIQRLDSNVRVQVQAWDSPGGSTIFSAKLDGTLDDLFGLQDQVAETLSRGLGVRPQESAAEPPTSNARAYEHYLRASEHLLRWTAGDTSRAVDLLRSAVALDPGFSGAWARLSGALVGMGALFDPRQEWFEEAEQTIERALALDPADPDAWTARGRMLWSPHCDFQSAEALRDLTRACAHPGHPYDARLWRSVLLTHVGLHEEALSMVNEAVEIQPDDLMSLIVKGETLGWMGDSESFLEYMERGVAQDPASPYGHLLHPIPLIYLDRFEEAEAAINSARGVVGEDALLLAVEGLLWAKRGEHARATSLVGAALRGLPSVSHMHHTAHYAAAAYATLGEGKLAVRELENAARTGMPNYPAFSLDPHFHTLRDEPDFQKMMKRLKSGWEALRQEFGEHA
jgi:TolB-like protein